MIDVKLLTFEKLIKDDKKLKFNKGLINIKDDNLSQKKT